MKRSSISRRVFLKAPAAAAACSVLPSLALPVNAATGCEIMLSPRYYPLESFVPELDISGKVAVVTGASRGIGRATAEALAARGVEVIGTSRDVSTVPNPPAYTMLDLDITVLSSVRRFVNDLSRTIGNRKVAILINNAGRFVLGGIIPESLSPNDTFYDQLRLASETLYHGHVRMTNAIMPMMPTSGYARLLFTVSIAGYATGGTDALTAWLQPYTSGKRALLGYANTLRGWLSATSSPIRVSTVNPYFIATTGSEHPNPIYMQPVDENGMSPTSEPFNQFLAVVRQLGGNALPASFVGETYAQLLQTQQPPANVVVGSRTEPWASRGGTAMIESMLVNENLASAPRFTC